MRESVAEEDLIRRFGVEAFPGALGLVGLTELSHAAAESLSKHEGEPSNMSKQVSVEMAGQGDPGAGFIIDVDFDYCDVNYSGYEILTRAQAYTKSSSTSSVVAEC